MSAFTGPLSIREHKVDSDIWELLSELLWELGQLGSGKFVRVPVGFVTDAASVPWFLTWLLPRWAPKRRRPAILHDYLCRSIAEGHPVPGVEKRSKADWVFLQAMKACGVNFVERWAFYIACALFTMFGSPDKYNPSQI